MITTPVFRSLLGKALLRTIEVLIDWTGKLENAPEDPKDWSVWFINTRTHIMVIAARESYENLQELIPEDGSFISGVRVQSGMDEAEATLMVNLLSRQLGLEESSGDSN
jgi:hypothetical protein